MNTMIRGVLLKLLTLVVSSSLLQVDGFLPPKAPQRLFPSQQQMQQLLQQRKEQLVQPLNLFTLNLGGGNTGGGPGQGKNKDNDAELSKDFDFLDNDINNHQCDHYYPIMMTDGDDEDPYGLFSDEMYRKRRNEIDMDTMIQFAIPIITPFIAYLTYDDIANAFHNIVETLSANKNWVAVDGNAYAIKIITPAINGLVVPAIAVLFATLTSMTISTLRLRQVEIRRCINTEAGELRTFEFLLASYPDDDIRDRCRQYLMQYCSRIIAESQPKNYDLEQQQQGDSNILSPRRGMDSEIYGVLQCLNVAAAERNPELSIPTPIMDASYACMGQLRQTRHDRMTALQSTYPPLHYGILGILALGECGGFLMETNQDILFFLNAVQLKVLWSMLVATFVACFSVFNDLSNPFSGSYSVSPSVDQLYIVRLALLEDGELCTLHQVMNSETKAKQEAAAKWKAASSSTSSSSSSTTTTTQPSQPTDEEEEEEEELVVVMDNPDDRSDRDANSTVNGGAIGTSNSTGVLE